MQPKAYYTVSEVAAHFGVGEQFIRSEIRRGRLAANWIGREYHISPEALEAYKVLTQTPKPKKGRGRKKGDDIVEIGA